MKLCAPIFLCLAFFIGSGLAQQCGRQARGRLCAGGLCCSQWGYCGSTPSYCGVGCQSQCRAAAATVKASNGGDVSTIITRAIFDQMLKHRNDDKCQSKGFYTYEAFVEAAKSFNGFGTTGDMKTRKRELAAFLAQTSHQTKGGQQGATDDPYAWGYCFIRASNPQTLCSSTKYPCPAGRQYYGRGPMQIAHNHIYAEGSKAIGADLLDNPELVATEPVVSFKTAIWYWMNPQGNKPSSHDAITGIWKPSDADKSAKRVPGYGAVTNVINGELECGHGKDDRVDSRIGFYKRYCDILGVSYGENLDCYSQTPFA